MTPRNYTLFLIFVAVIGAFSSLVNDMYLPTIPSMMREFHTTPSMTQMGISMAMLGMAVGSVFFGSGSDRYGRKPVLIISLAIFVAATAVSIFSRSIGFFIVCRLFQGVGAGGAMVLSTSIPADVYQGRMLAKLMAMVGAINGIAPAAAPLLGGFMADSVGWRGIFVVLLVIGIVMTVWTLRTPETLPPERRMQVRSTADYMRAYKTLFLNGRFMIYVTMKAIAIGLLYAYISSGPFIIQDHYGFSAMQFGLIFGGNALAMALGSTLALRFKVLKQALITGAVGMFIFAACAAAVMWTGMHFVWYEAVIVPMMLFCGMIFSSSNTLSMEVGRQEAGSASAILSVVKYVFAAIVAPVVGLGDILHTTAITFVAVAALALILAWPTSRLRPLADMVKN